MKVMNRPACQQFANDPQVASKIPCGVEHTWDRRASNSVNLVFIDAGVEDKEILLNGLLPGYRAIVLSANQDGVEQITHLLPESKDLESLYSVSHGAPGILCLGTSQLSFCTIDRYRLSLQKWADALAADAQILLYSWRMAEGTDGLTFVHQFHEIVRRAIAAEHFVKV